MLITFCASHNKQFCTILGFSFTFIPFWQQNVQKHGSCFIGIYRIFVFENYFHTLLCYQKKEKTITDTKCLFFSVRREVEGKALE